MTWKHIAVALVLWAILPAVFLSAAYQSGGSDTHTVTVVLYDGTLGTTPDQQGFSFLSPGTSATQQYANGATVLDSTADITAQAGYFNLETYSLDRLLGFKAQMNIQILEEEHANPDRAGFSIIVLSDDLLGLELAFWENEIWAQEGGSTPDLFTHAEGVTFDTTADLVSYELAVLDDGYTLSADGVPILTGPLRDYTAFEGFPDVYETPGLFFLGDDTSSGMAKSAISYAALGIQTEATPTATAQPTATITPPPEGSYRSWLPCLKGVD
jgi:hypothetical protein